MTDDASPVQAGSAPPRRAVLVRVAIASALSLVVAALVSPGLSRSVRRYELGQYTTGALRAPFDFSVIDEAATQQRREEAARQSPLVLVVDRSVVRNIDRRLAEAFASMAKLFVEQDEVRRATEGDLEKLTRAQRSARERRARAAAARFLRDRIAPAWAAFEHAVGVALTPEERTALANERFAAPLSASLVSLLDDIYTRPIVADMTALHGQVHAESATAAEPGRLVLRSRTGESERLIADLSQLQDRSEAVRSLPDRAQRLLAPLSPDVRAALVHIAASQLRADVSPDPDTTRTRKLAAARAVIPVSLNFHRNQLIVGEGQPVTRQTLVALDALRQRARPAAYYQRVAGFAILFWLLLLLGCTEARLAGPAGDSNGLRRFLYAASTLALAVLLFRVWLVVVDILVSAVPGGPRLGFVLLLPLVAVPMLTELVIDRTAALVQLAAVAVAAGLLSDTGAPLAGYVFVVGLLGLQRVRRCTDRRCVLRAGMVAGMAALAGSVALLLLAGNEEPPSTSLLTCAMAFGGGFLAGPVVIAASPIVEWLFG